MRRRVALLVLALLPAVPAMMGIGGRALENLEVRIEGYFDRTRREVNGWKNLDIQIGTNKPRKFALTAITVLSGRSMGAEVLKQVEPVHPNFYFDGDPKLLEQISSALPNQLVKVTGYTAFGPQRILVNKVEVSEPITGPTPTPNMRKKLLGF
jgi:hypothetical protein